MRSLSLPEPTCPHGYTYDDLEKILGHRLKAFWKWMSGQTMMLCDGRTYQHNREHNAFCPHLGGDVYTWECAYPGGGHYETTACSGMLPGMPVSPDETLKGHGGIVYPWDLERFMLGLPVVD